MHLWIWGLLYVTSVVLGDQCPSSELHYEASNCNSLNNRWVFKVPNDSATCQLTSESIPKRQSCDKSCPTGQHLDVELQKCVYCPVGTYSRGDVLELSTWSTIPDELSAEVTYSYETADGCNSTRWVALGDYLLGTVTAGCSAVLSLQLNNLQDGEISFMYNIDDSAIMAFFTIQNEHCTRLPASSFILQHTGPNLLYNVSTPLRKGRYVMHWDIFVDQSNFRSLMSEPMGNIKIVEIRVRGTPPILHCNPCSPGTFADSVGMGQCTRCPANTYSKTGAQHCDACTAHEYAPPGSGKCIPRLPCTEKDYMAVWTHCDQTGKSRKEYKWIEPMICDIDKGVALPPPESAVDCLCPVGTRVLNATACENCPAGQTVKDTTCLHCDADKVPVFGMHYNRWTRFPPQLQTWCISMFKNGCLEWTTNMDHIGAGVGLHPNTASFLRLSIPFGFIGSNEPDPSTVEEVILNPPIPDTYLRFEFELLCGSCKLILHQQTAHSADSHIMQWAGRVERQNYTLIIKNSAATNFTWELQKKVASHGSSQQDVLHQHVKIYQIEVTNAKGLGVIGCRKCLKGIKDGKCISCPNGLFYSSTFNETTRQEVVNCTSCPENTILRSDDHTARTISEACIPCAPGTKAFNHSVCVADTMPVGDNGMIYNLTALLKKNRTIQGANLFTPAGTKYNYEYHLSFIREKPVRCFEQFDSLGIQLINELDSMICRQTIVHSSSSPNKKQYVLPLSLGNHIVKAVQSNHSQSFWEEVNTNLTRAGWSSDNAGTDLHYIFATDIPTEKCPSGIMSVVTFRCGLGQSPELINNVVFPNSSEEGHLEVPPLCPDATCDGCTYHFMWRSPMACPICSERQLIHLSGECRYGSRHVFAITRQACRIPQELRVVQEVRCPLLTTGQIVAIFVTGFIVVTLSTIIYACYRKNKKLEYKYMKLVQSKAGQEQPTSCALEYNEEDNLDTFGRRGIRQNNNVNPAFELEPTDSRNSKLPNSASYALKMPWPILGPILFKKSNQQDLQNLPENEEHSGVA